MWLILTLCILSALTLYVWVHERSQDESIATYRIMKRIAEKSRKIGKKIFIVVHAVVIYTLTRVRIFVKKILATLEGIRNHKQMRKAQLKRKKEVEAKLFDTNTIGSQSLRGRIETSNTNELTESKNMLE